MSREVDQHVVEMVFDNDKFEKEARTTMSTLDKLKEKLGFGDASDGFDKVDKAVSKLDFRSAEDGVDRLSSKFSALGVAGMAAIQNITNKVIQMGEQLINALVFDAPKAGFQEYELQQNTIQTIMSATGESLKNVKAELDQLNEYADNTIYKFSDMTQNISKFTNQGVKLDIAVDAIKGISNLAADAGANAQQASHAMYNFAQALGAGYVKLIDWKSIQNATMDTVDFKNALIQMAGQLGTVQKELNKTTGKYDYFLMKEKTTGSGKNKKTTYEKTYVTAASFMETLQKGWLTNDVLLKTLGVYAGEVSEATLRSMNFTEDQIAEMIELGKRASEAATQIKTATQMFDTWTEAAGTGWAKSFEHIFGDFYEARDLFTSIGHKVGDELDRMSDSRNKFLEGWHKGGGYKNFTETLNNIVDAGLELKDLFGRGFMIGFLDAFGQSDAVKTAIDFTEKIKMAVERIKESLKPNGATDSLYAVLMGISQGIGGAFSIVSNFFTSLGSAIGNLLTMLSPFTKSIGYIIHMAGAWIADIARYIRNNKVFEKTFKNILLILKPAIDLINTIGVKAAEAFAKFREWAKENHVFEKVWNVFATVLGLVAIAVNKIAEVVPKAYKKVKEFLKGLWSGVSSWAKPAFDWISEKFNKLVTIGSQIQKGDFSGVTALFDELKASFDKGVEDAKKWFDENIASNPIYQAISGFFGGIVDAVGKFFTTDSNGKEITFSKDATWWDKMVGYFSNGAEKATKWWNENVDPIIKAVDDFFKPITSAISDFFGPGTYVAGYKGGNAITVSVTWWDKIKNYFIDGYNSAVTWWSENVDPVVKAVEEFFKPITSSITDFFSPGTYTAGYKGGHAITVNVTWWDKVKNYFIDGYANATKWWTENVDPVVDAIGKFFGPIIDAVSKFFATDSEGKEITFSKDASWWDHLVTYFNTGKQKAEDWFKDNVQPIIDTIKTFYGDISEAISNVFGEKKDNKLVAAFGLTASDVFGPRGTKEMHDALYPEKSWWEQILEKFADGVTNIRHFFMLLPETPIVKAIGDFFAKIREKINAFFADSTDEEGNTVNWWTKLYLYFIKGKNKVVEFFEKNVVSNPIFQAIGGFFTEVKNKIAEFFIPETDENGNSRTWWDKIKYHFLFGKNKLVQWFNTNVATNPIYQAIEGFFSGIIAKINEFFTTEVAEDGTEKTWWGKVQGIFRTGIDFLVGWFNEIKDNEVVKSIGSFFGNIGKAIRDTIQNGFGTYSKVIHFSDHEEDIVETYPWYHRFIDVFEEGFKKIKEWFKTMADNNPIIGAVSNFFSDTWEKISGVFTGEGGGFDFKTGATNILTGLQEKLGGVVENLKNKHGEVSGKTKDIMGAITDYVTGLFKTDPSAAEEVKKDSNGPITLIGLVGNVFQLMFEAVALMWQGLSDIIGKVKLDSLWAFLDKLVGYWNAFTWGNVAIGVKNITEILSFRQRVELLEKLAAVFASIALLAGVIAGFATLEQDQMIAGGLFLLALIGIVVGLLAYSNHLEKAGSGSKKAAKNLDGITQFTGSLAQTIGGTAFLAALTTLASAASGAVKDIVQLGLDGADYKDIWSAIGYLAMTLLVLMAFANGGNFLMSLISKNLGSGLGFNLDLKNLVQGGDTGFIEKAMNLSSTGIDNLTNIAALALSLKSVTGAIKEIHDLMKENGWKNAGDVQDELLLIGEIMAGIIGAMALDTLVDRKIKDKNTNRADVKKSLGDALESAANILAIAQAVKMLVEALEPLVKLEDTYGGEESRIGPAIAKLSFLFGEVLAVFETHNVLDKIFSNKWGNSTVSDTSTKGIIAAIINNPIIAMAGSVWILVQAVVSLIDAAKSLPEDGENLEFYLGKIEELLGYVFGADSLFALATGYSSSLGGGKGAGLAFATAGMLMLGVGAMIIAIKDLMGTIPDQTKLEQFDMAFLKLKEIVLNLLAAIGTTELLTAAGESLNWDAIAKIGALMLGLGLLVGGLTWVGGNAASQFGTAFTQIAEGVTKIKEAIVGMGSNDIDKLNAFSQAVGVLADAQAAVSGAKYGGGFLERLLSYAFGVNVGNGENLETLGTYTEGFSEHIPAIMNHIRGINNDLKVFDAFIQFIENLSVLMYISHELSGGWEINTLAGQIEETTGKLGRAVHNLAQYKEDYDAAMTGLWFIEDFTQFARNFKNDSDLASGISEVEEAALGLAVSDIPNYMAAIAAKVADGITKEDKTIVGRVSSLITNPVTTIRGKYDSFTTAGKYLAQGLANGMTSMIGNADTPGTVYYAGYQLAAAALNGINKGAGIESPSKEAYASGEFIVAGLANAMRDDSYIAYNEGTDLASEALMGMRSVLSDDLAYSVNDDFLTIRPVMDMSDIQNGMDTIDAYTHGYRDFTFGGWNAGNNALKHEMFGAFRPEWDRGPHEQH